jgi:hypothetical protein
MFFSKFVAALYRGKLFTYQRMPGLHRALRQMRHSIAAAIRVLAPAKYARFGPPKNLISLYELLLSGDPTVKGRILFHRQKVLATEANSMAALAGLDHRTTQPFPALWSHHREARLVTRTLGLILPPKQFVVESSYPGAEWLEPASQYLRLPRATRLKGNYTSIVSLWNKNNVTPNFSHWLLDALPRLAAMEEFPADTTALTPGPLAAYQIESLKMLGLEGRFRRTPEEHLIVENYYLSSPTSQNVRDNPYALDFLRRSFLPKASTNYNGPKRFIIDRSGAGRGLINREEFNSFFRDLGWAIIDTATLSLADEIKLFAEAEAFAGAIGSGFTNAVWCKPGCAVFQIVPHNFFEPSTEWICKRNELRWRFLVCEGDFSFCAKAPMAEVKRVLKELDLL